MTQSQTPSTSELDPLELPEPNPPKVPLWAENYVYEVTCPDAGVGFFLHLGRQPFNTDLWRDTFVADTGEEEVYLWRGFGKGASANGPGGSQLKFLCQESFERWIIIFDGAALRVPRREVSFGAGGALRDGPIVSVRLQIEVVADTPIWDLGTIISSHDWGKAHYQQSLRVVGGELEVDGRRMALDNGVATRDHTRGPRDFNGLGSYAWIHGGFPGGRRFISLALDPREGLDQPPIRIAMIADKQEIYPAEIIETAVPQTADGAPMKFTLRLKGPDGIETIEAERLSTVMLGVGAPNHLMLGPSTDSTTRAHMFPSPTRFSWNGETCYGYSERSIAVE